MTFRQYIVSLFIALSLLLSACHSQKEIAKEKGSHSGRKTETKIVSHYAEMLQVPDKSITNIELYTFIDKWYGTPYKYGGNSRSGIDCSNFACQLYREIYHRNMNGSSASIYRQCRVISKKDLREGDLVFFKIGTDEISHIGIYLQNNHFVHATTKKGIMIDNLDEPYYAKYFYKAGRP